MRYLGLALYAEGPTDHRFLPNILHKTVENLCLLGTDELVQVGDVLEIHPPLKSKDEDGKTKILHAARDVWGSFDVLFVHSDAGGNFDRAVEERVKPAQRLIDLERGHDSVRCIGIIPVREMEAWAMVDGDSLRAAFGATLSDHQLGVPPDPHRVETILDPKQALEQAYATVVGNRRPKGNVQRFLSVISERIPLARLQRVPAFRWFELELQQALLDLNILKTRVYDA